MADLPLVDSGDYHYGLQIPIGDDRYVIRYDTTDDGYQKDDDRLEDSYQFLLVKIVFDGTKYKSGTIAKTRDGLPVNVNLNPFILESRFQNDTRLAYQSFLDKVNRFIQEAGIVDTSGFPEDGTVTEQFEWLFKETVLQNGKVVVK